MRVNLTKGVITVGSWTLLSRILGMVREILLSTFIGAGPLLDAFVAAFRLPNIFRRFFAEGAFNAAFVPLFAKRYESKMEPNEFANNVFANLLTILLILTSIAMIFMPGLVFLTAAGFAPDERFDLTVEFGRVMFPYILLISLAALFSGILNTTGRFAVAAAAPVILNIVIVAALLIAWAINSDIIAWLVWSIPTAGILQLTLLWLATRRTGIKITLAFPKWNKDIAKLIKIAIPAALAGGVLQINLLVGQLVASQETGAISFLYFADRLYQLPLGIAGIAVGTVLLPKLSRHLKSGDSTKAQHTYSQSAEMIWFVALPSSFALCLIPLPLVSALFEHGKTTKDDALTISYATTIYGIGLPAFMIQKLLQPLYFAREDTKTPLRFAFVSMILNAILAIGLFQIIGWIAVAIAASASAWVTTILLWLRAKQFGQAASALKTSTGRIQRTFFASLAMGCILWAINQNLHSTIETSIERVLFAVALIFIGISIYLIFIYFLRAFPKNFEKVG
tara:strand:- start:4030 stop:5556 length:1527 start_codon:yes stop_codon:yes gene_type:complete